jgi:hypothetical protein
VILQASDDLFDRLRVPDDSDDGHPPAAFRAAEKNYRAGLFATGIILLEGMPGRRYNETEGARHAQKCLCAHGPLRNERPVADGRRGP